MSFCVSGLLPVLKPQRRWESEMMSLAPLWEVSPRDISARRAGIHAERPEASLHEPVGAVLARRGCTSGGCGTVGATPQTGAPSGRIQPFPDDIESATIAAPVGKYATCPEKGEDERAVNRHRLLRERAAGSLPVRSGVVQLPSWTIRRSTARSPSCAFAPADPVRRGLSPAILPGAFLSRPAGRTRGRSFWVGLAGAADRIDAGSDPGGGPPRSTADNHLRTSSVMCLVALRAAVGGQ